MRKEESKGIQKTWCDMGSPPSSVFLPSEPILWNMTIARSEE